MRRQLHQTFASRLDDGPVVVVAGDEQVGKTQFVLQALHGGSPERLAATLYIELGLGQGREVLLTRLLRALAGVEGIDFRKWSSVLSDLDAAVARAIDVADNRQLRIVIDGMNWLEASNFAPLMDFVRRYARRSQWLFVGRGFPDLSPYPRLDEALFELGPLSRDQLEELARQLRPDDEERWFEEALDVCQGRPGHFLRLLDQSALFQHFHDLDDDQKAWIDLLTTLRFPVPDVVLASAVGLEPEALVDDPRLQQLQDRALIRPVEDGWSAGHGVSYPWREFRDPDHRLDDDQLLELLAKSAHPQMAVERLRIFLEHHRFDEARALLIECGEEVISRGLSPELWELLHDVESPLLTKWRLLAGVHCGVSDAIDEVRQISISDDDFGEDVDLLRLHAVVSVYFYGGKFGDAADLAARCLHHVTKGACVSDENYDLAFRLNYTRSSALICIGELEKALDEIDAIEARGMGHQLMVKARRASILASMLQTEESLAICREVGAALSDLNKLDAQTVAYDLLRTLVINRDFEMAGTVLDELLANIGTGALVLSFGRRTLILQAIVAYETGRYTLCRAVIERLRDHCRANPQDLLLVRSLELGLRVETGEFEGLETEIAGICQMAEKLDDGEAYYACREKELHLDISRGRRTPLHDEVDLPHHDRSVPQAVEIGRYHQRLRWEEAQESELIADPTKLSGRALLPGLIASSQHAALDGDGHRAASLIDHALTEARRRGQIRFEVAAHLAHLENLAILAGPNLEAQVANFDSLVTDIPSQRYRHQAEFFAFFGADPPQGVAAPAILESLASGVDVAPTVARRSAHLLGEEVQLDALDRRLLAALTRRLDWTQPRYLSDTQPDSGMPWGICRTSLSTWHEDSATVSLSDHQILWKFLIYLAENDGFATKEELINQVWEIDEYHPLRHDNRIRLAASKLRKKLQTQTPQAEFVTADDQGYRLVGLVRLR